MRLILLSNRRWGEYWT